MAENARKPLDQDEYNKRYIPLAEEYGRRYIELTALESELESLLRRREIIGKYLSTIETTSIADSVFDMKLWGCIVERAVVGLDGNCEFILHDGCRHIRVI